MEQIPLQSMEGNSHTANHNQYEIDVYKLIHLSKELPVTEIKVSEFESKFDDVCWSDDIDRDIAPREVVEAYKNKGYDKALEENPYFSKHLLKLKLADYTHPILIFEGQIIDGVHRLAKAYCEGKEQIPARILTEIPQEAIIKIRQ